MQRHLSSPVRALRLAALASLYVATGCGGAADPDQGPEDDGGEPPHIVLVLIDTLRADHTSLYGYERPTTPHMERIAEVGLVGDRHFVNAPWTKPSIASILTGLHPTAHGSRVGQFSQGKGKDAPQVDILSEAHWTFVELLQQAGYRTLAHTSNYNMNPDWGYAQGYDHYEFAHGSNRKRTIENDRASRDFVFDALESADGPTFVWAHMMGVHQYYAPDEFLRFEPDGATPVDMTTPGARRVEQYETVENSVAQYDNSILFDDDLVGQIYDRIVEKHPNTILIVTSDHGEEFMDHGAWEHCSTLYNEMLKVPLLVVGPGVPEGVRVDGITDSLDLFPSILALAGLDVDELPRAGQPIVVDGDVTEGKSETFAEQHHRGPFVRFALNRNGKKLIRSHKKRWKESGDARIGPVTSTEWYDNAWTVETDEMVFQPTPDEAKDFFARVERFREATTLWFEREVGERAVGEVSADDLEKLKALGYGGGD